MVIRDDHSLRHSLPRGKWIEYSPLLLLTSDRLCVLVFDKRCWYDQLLTWPRGGGKTASVLASYSPPGSKIRGHVVAKAKAEPWDEDNGGDQAALPRIGRQPSKWTADLIGACQADNAFTPWPSSST